MNFRAATSPRAWAARAAGLFGPFRARSTAGALRIAVSRTCSRCAAAGRSRPFAQSSRLHLRARWACCLRPCQQVVNAEEYRHEVDRVIDFLRTSVTRSFGSATRRPRPRQHRSRFRTKPPASTSASKKLTPCSPCATSWRATSTALNGVAVTPSVDPQAVELWVRPERLLAAPAPA